MFCSFTVCILRFNRFSLRLIPKCAQQIQDGCRLPSWKKNENRYKISNRLTDFDDLYKNVHFGDCIDAAPHLVVQTPPRLHFGAVNRLFQAKCTKYSNIRNIKTTAVIPAKFCKMINISDFSSQAVPKWTPQIQDRPSFSKQLNAISLVSTTHDRFQQ